ncbi:MAG: T9SS type A sorting domain-containing protein [Bacteroidales bacterium]|nr:T9SS type A sorting domain-containing protein [Bacteroidales bacterium]
MKKLFSLIVVMALCLSNLFAIGETDSLFVKYWQIPIDNNFTMGRLPAFVPSDNMQGYAEVVSSFDAQGSNFDAIWDSSKSAEYPIANLNPITGSSNDHGVTDFKGSFKVLADNYNMYVLLKFDDDYVTGNESAELSWAPYFKLNALDKIGNDGKEYPYIWYCRFTDFGAYKATIKKTGFVDAMTIDFANKDGGLHGAVNWNGTNDILTNNIFVDNKTVVGSNTVKWIITIGYPALTGSARPEFDLATWRLLNNEKGISFDIKVNDEDTDDSGKRAEYWWNSKSNECYAYNWYAGFMGLPKEDGINTPKLESSIFGKVTPSQITLTKIADVAIFNSVGQEMKKVSKTDRVDLSNLSKGVYFVSAKGETKKIIK